MSPRGVALPGVVSLEEQVWPRWRKCVTVDAGFGAQDTALGQERRSGIKSVLLNIE